jgi:hypothetical protein
MTACDLYGRQQPLQRDARQPLLHSLQPAGTRHAAFGKERALDRTYYYNAPLTTTTTTNSARGSKRFFRVAPAYPLHHRALGAHAPSLRDGSLVEKGIDVAIAVESLSLAYEDAYDTVLLVSAYGDYVQLVEAIKRKGNTSSARCFAQSVGGCFWSSPTSLRWTTSTGRRCSFEMRPGSAEDAVLLVKKLLPG